MINTPHINPMCELAKKVLMPGDPKRATYIANKFLKDVEVFNEVRGMLGYTGTYKGKKISVMASGMGIPSMGIYSYELFKIYDVDTIIRIGTSGSNSPDVNILDVVLASSSYSLSTFAKVYDGFEEKELTSSKKLNDKIINTADELNINLKVGRIITSDVFNPYCDSMEEYNKNYPDNLTSLASEMESFALFYMARKFNKNATCLLTVVDSPYDDRVIPSIEREKSLDDMIVLALESIIKED